MSVSLKEKITADMKEAMRAHAKERLGTIRLILAAIKQREVDERIVLDDAAVIAAINKMIKQRKDSIEQFEKANRMDLSAIEHAELAILMEYLPAQLSAAEVEAAIDAAMKATNPKTMQDMGKVMAILKPQLTGKADMSDVSAKIKAKLAG
jgi:uncharacterized protein YqeY